MLAQVFKVHAAYTIVTVLGMGILCLWRPLHYASLDSRCGLFFNILLPAPDRLISRARDGISATGI